MAPPLASPKMSIGSYFVHSFLLYFRKKCDIIRKISGKNAEGCIVYYDKILTQEVLAWINTDDLYQIP